MLTNLHIRLAVFPPHLFLSSTPLNRVHSHSHIHPILAIRTLAPTPTELTHTQSLRIPLGTFTLRDMLALACQSRQERSNRPCRQEYSATHMAARSGHAQTLSSQNLIRPLLVPNLLSIQLISADPASTLQTRLPWMTPVTPMSLELQTRTVFRSHRGCSR